MSTAVLLPIALVQGYWLLRRTPSLPVPEGRSGRFGTQGGAAFQVVGIGDSVIAGTGVNQLCSSVTGAYARLLHERVRHDVEWRVFGRVGATTAQILDELLPGAPPADVYVVSGGVNDTTRGVSPKRFADNLRRLFACLRSKSPRAAILYCGLPPFEHLPALPWPLNSILAARARAYQRHALEIVARDGNAFCFRFPPTMCPSQFASDGFHPAESACERWATGLLDLWPLATSTQSGTATNIEQPRKRPIVLKLPTRRANQAPAAATVAAVTCTSRTRTK